MQFSLDQRAYRLGLSKKQLWDECNRRGRRISYSSVCAAVNYPGEIAYKLEKKVNDTIAELEAEQGITDVNFD